MKRNLLILFITAITILTIHVIRQHVYPMHYNLPKLMRQYEDYSSKLHTVLNKLIEDKTSNKKLIFWETPVSLGMRKSELIEINPSTSKIKYQDRIIDVNIIYDCTYEMWDAELENINVRIPYSLSIENDLMSYYGEKYIRSRKGDDYFSVWAFDEGFAVLEKHVDPSGEAYLYLELGKYDYDWKRRVAYGAYNDIFEDVDRYLVDIVPQKDSIDHLIEKRKEKK